VTEDQIASLIRAIPGLLSLMAGFLCHSYFNSIRASAIIVAVYTVVGTSLAGTSILIPEYLGRTIGAALMAGLAHSSRIGISKTTAFLRNKKERHNKSPFQQELLLGDTNKTLPSGKHPFVTATLAAAIVVLICIALLNAELVRSQKTIDLPNGVSIELPRGWTILHQDDKARSGDAADILLNEPTSGKFRLLAAAASSDPSLAFARITVTKPDPDMTQAALEEMDSGTSAVLVFHNLRIALAVSKNKAKSDDQITEVDPLRIGYWGKDRALVLRYKRLSQSGHLLCIRQYLIPTTHLIIELTVAYRMSNESELLPTLDRIRDSLRY
jgi:hypothetical protein